MFNPEQVAFSHNNSPSERLSGLSPIQSKQRLMTMEPFQRFKKLVDDLSTNYVEEL